MHESKRLVTAKVAEFIHNDLIFLELVVASLRKEQPKEIQSLICYLQLIEEKKDS